MAQSMAEQQVDFYAFPGGSLPDRLDLQLPPFLSETIAFRQLNYLGHYAADIGCKSIVIERHYIDRDYMEDHSVFYSRNLVAYPNACQRVHFFRLAVPVLKRALARLAERGALLPNDHKGEKFQALCRRFSAQYYLGFSVIKPLHGCPVGRTVLTPYGEGDGSFRRRFDGIRPYTAHLCGVDLTVHGLPFQQQDVGVSACATTAVWSALQKVRDFEDIGSATPAEITVLAAKYALPFGRAMPSEGLTIGQMCQAIQAIGVSPNLFRLDESSSTKGLLYSSLASGSCPILLVSKGRRPNIVAHAMTATGMKLSHPRTGTLIAPGIKDSAGDLLALYVHDDRNGPYLKANVLEVTGHVVLEIVYKKDLGGKRERWRLTHLLIPMHAKIRLSFGAMRKIGQDLAGAFQANRSHYSNTSGSEPPPVKLETFICRGHTYVRKLLLSKTRMTPSRVIQLAKTIPLPRYVGIVRLRTSDVGWLDFLVDTTSTPRNINCVGIAPSDDAAPLLKTIASELKTKFKCLRSF